MSRSSILQPARKATGFSKTSNLLLFLSTACIFAVFCLYRIKSLDYDHWGRQSRPGEWFWFKEGFRGEAMKMHLRSVIPAGALMPLQFLPKFRQKYMKLHRLNGRLVLILLMIGNITAVIISPRAFGGTITTQTACVSLALLISTSITKGIRGIRGLELDVHRAWMLRTWAYAGAILTMRPINIILLLLSKLLAPNRFQGVSTCGQLVHMYEMTRLPLADLFSNYPLCQHTAALDSFVVVQARLSPARPDQIAALTTLTFGPALWMATLVHVLAVECYLSATKDEDERLRMVSLRRKNPVRLDAIKAL